MTLSSIYLLQIILVILGCIIAVVINKFSNNTYFHTKREIFELLVFIGIVPLFGYITILVYVSLLVGVCWDTMLSVIFKEESNE
jgi:uncharacterized membrane protein YoaK (UPF0700 family)